MGTRINLLIDHDLPDFRDVGEILARLEATLVAAGAVCDFWLTSEPDGSHIPQKSWEAIPESPRRPGLRCFDGPGSLSLSVTASAARVRTGGRWRGFLANEAMRRVHLLAFRTIARVLGASFMAIHADSDAVNDLFWGGRSAWECAERMEQLWGPPEGSVERVEARIVEAAGLYLPGSVWFLEDIRGEA
ncbi:hypothetical protein TA3x_001661 [Tundrisphaera sp. TA3]|uniref:hypothetical protein n=1 Tax=Tundrisphaera sp. TA3 TaxID=3435775 RepID=UPI003EBA3F19